MTSRHVSRKEQQPNRTEQSKSSARQRQKAKQDWGGSVVHLGSCDLPTRFGTFRMAAFEVGGVRSEFICLSTGDLQEKPPLVRLHSECLTGDALGSLRCDCGEQLAAALTMISEQGCGLVMYLRQEGRGIGLVNKVKAYGLQDAGLDTVDANLALGFPADKREYASAAKLLTFLGLPQIRILTNNPEKCKALEEQGIAIVERIGLTIDPNSSNLHYLHTKAERMGHYIDFEDATVRTDQPA